ncbi:MAG: hypothetical protein ACHRXM_01210 [Isosphaerales bacterium]
MAVCALEDAYHGLLIGPCDEAISGPEEGACRLVFKMFVTMNEGLDCNYEEWVRLFRGAVHEAAALHKKGEIVEPCQLAEAEQAAQTGMPILLEEGCRIERRGEGWVIVDPSGGCLFEIERCMWSSDEPRVFDTPAGAVAAFLRAQAYCEGRKRRYREAMIRLGRPLQGPSRYEEESSLGN